MTTEAGIVPQSVDRGITGILNIVIRGNLMLYYMYMYMYNNAIVLDLLVSFTFLDLVDKKNAGLFASLYIYKTAIGTRFSPQPLFCS